MNKKPIPVRTGGMRKFPIPITIIASARIVKMIAAIFFMVFSCILEGLNCSHQTERKGLGKAIHQQFLPQLEDIYFIIVIVE